MQIWFGAVCSLRPLAPSIEYEITKLNIIHVVALRFIFSLCIDRVLFMCVLHHIGCKKKNSATHLKCVRKHETEYWDDGRRTTKVHWKPNRKPPEQIEWTCGVYCLLSFIDIIQFVVYERKYGELYIIVDILYCLLLFARLFASRQRWRLYWFLRHYYHLRHST